MTSIHRRKVLQAVAASSTALFAGMPAIVLGQTATKWRVQTLWGAGEDTFKFFEEFAEKVKVNTGGRLEIQTFAAGAVVGVFETLDAVGQNVLQGQSTYPGYWAGKEPALAVIGDFAFGYRTRNSKTAGSTKKVAWICCARPTSVSTSTLWVRPGGVWNR
jgi:TRAP-type mannitol/chloroaromatic compound transport system substrate-binding protein